MTIVRNGFTEKNRISSSFEFGALFTKFQKLPLPLSLKFVKFLYSEKATKFYEISTLLLTVCTVVKSLVEISQNFVAFSEYMNFHWSRTIFSASHSKPALVINVSVSLMRENLRGLREKFKHKIRT